MRAPPGRFLIYLLTVIFVGTSLDLFAQDLSDVIAARVAAALARLAQAFGAPAPNNGVEGRILARVPGSYEFAP
jgi:hypothetical protein